MNRIHPIEKIDYTPFIYSREMKDNDCFILERSGRPVNRTDQDSYWNRNTKDKDNIMKYNVQFIHDDVHPEFYALPCCGKKPVTYGISSYVNVLIRNEDTKPYWEMGQITDKINNVTAADMYNVREKLIVLSFFLTFSDITKPIPKSSEQIIAYIFPNV